MVSGALIFPNRGEKRLTMSRIKPHKSCLYRGKLVQDLHLPSPSASASVSKNNNLDVGWETLLLLLQMNCKSLERRWMFWCFFCLCGAANIQLIISDSLTWTWRWSSRTSGWFHPINPNSFTSSKFQVALKLLSEMNLSRTVWHCHQYLDMTQRNPTPYSEAV